MASDYEIELPYPPSVNGYWRNFKGRQIISKRGRDYRKEAIAHLENIGLAGEGLDQRLHVSVIIHPPTLRKYDIDNWCKAPFDALTHAGFWLDDEQVDSLRVKKAHKIKGGLLKLAITTTPC